MGKQWFSRQAFIVVLAVSLALNLVLAALLIAGALSDRLASKAQEFSLLSPQVAAMELDEFLAKQSLYQANYLPLRSTIDTYVKTLKKGKVGYYFEDLRTGAWVGVSEKSSFTPGSLLKVPAVAAAAKNIEEGSLTLKSPVTILPEDVDPTYGPLGSRGSGYALSVYELMNYTITYSDNTANNVLRRILPYGDFAEAMFGMGLPYATNIKNNVMNVTAKDFGNVMRSLYYSSYTKRGSSQLILSMMAGTQFPDALPAGVPGSVVVAHKIGIWDAGSQHHDCGIVYTAQKEYILCVMTSGLSQAESDAVIAELSRRTYLYVTSTKQLVLD